jgi:CMP-N,N'-diacetyllegionaminic acid synthase
MINGKSVIAIIPARAGSKGLPGKNIKDLCGKPLIAWTIESGLASKYIDTVVVSTDSPVIADIAQQYGAAAPFLRPSRLATDEANSFDVIKHTLNYYDQELEKCFFYTVLLEPTSPIRENDDVDLMLEKLDEYEQDFDGIVSLGEVQCHPGLMKKVINHRITPFSNEFPINQRRQNYEKLYFPYGVAIVLKTQTLLKEETFYPIRTTHYIIKRHQCFEIDDIYDFLTVEAILQNLRKTI